MLVTSLGIYTEKRLYDELMLLKMATVKYDMSFVVCIQGRERSGKSTISSQMAYILDDTVLGDITRCAFTVNQFKEATNKARSMGKGHVVMLDEGGNIFNADDSAQRTAKQIKKIIMMNGKYNIIYLICVPSVFDLTPYMRIHRIDWLMSVYKEVRKDDNDEWEFKKGAYACYSYDQKLRMLMLAKHKYDYSASKPAFRGRFLNTIKPTDIWGEAYETKKDKAIEEVFNDEKHKDTDKLDIAVKMMELRGKKLTTDEIAQALGYKSSQSVYNLLKKKDEKKVENKNSWANESEDKGFGVLGAGNLPDDDEE